MTTNQIRQAYEVHLAMLARSDVAEHRENAKQIALTALIQKRAAHAKHPRKTEPYKTEWQITLQALDALIDELSH